MENNPIEISARLLRERNIAMTVTYRKRGNKEKKWRWAARCFIPNGNWLSRNGKTIESAVNHLLIAIEKANDDFFEMV